MTLALPAGSLDHYVQASAAVRKEQRRCGRARLMTCHGVALQPGQPTIFRLDVGAFSDVEWSWEGARAFKPEDLPEFDDPLALGAPAHDPSKLLWRGEVVAVDEDDGAIYLAAEGPDAPTSGRFIVQPFDFHESLAWLLHLGRPAPWQADLAARLQAALHPRTEPGLSDARAVAALRGMWRHPWTLLWGPPGTGKTWTLGRQVARCVTDRDERILVVSTTNRATDNAALQIGAALAEARRRPTIRRVGSGVDFGRLEAADLAAMVGEHEAGLRRKLSVLAGELERAVAPVDKGRLAAEMGELRAALGDASLKVVLDRQVQVVIGTVFNATGLLSRLELQQALADGTPLFTTILIDEAGMVSRAATAALSLWASERVVLIGDPRQLAPVARETRVLPPQEARWLACSGLGHLQGPDTGGAMVQLRLQHRMAPAIRAVVSAYSYDDALEDADGVAGRPFASDALLADQPRAIWYVLDEESGEGVMRAERGPARRSWLRGRTPALLERLFASHPQMRQGPGLLLSPFRAQTRALRQWIVAGQHHGWQASTVHAQQGAEAPWVIFDTVHAGSTGWPTEEWLRLINVALSRAREVVIVLATRAEMQQPYLAPLLPLLAPRVLRGAKGGKEPLAWVEVAAQVQFKPGSAARADATTLGGQIAQRKAQRPVMSAEQERLCQLPLDGGPRLVRGVAGSGKTWVMTAWLARTLFDPAFAHLERIWVVYGNASLRGLISRQLQQSWRALAGARALPWQRVQLLHVRSVLAELLTEVEGDAEVYGFDYDGMAEHRLLRQDTTPIEARCDALFVDEAQDLGHHALRALFALVRPWRQDAPQSRAVHIFFDNNQRLFSEGTPRWSELGLDLRGRSTVMKESWRTTRPIAELARNVLYGLVRFDRDPDHREYLRRGLLEQIGRGARVWWRERFSPAQGPLPSLHLHGERSAEVKELARATRAFIAEQGVLPGDLRILANDPELRRDLHDALQRALSDLPVRVRVQTSQDFATAEDTLIITTAHSFKGHEAEVVFIAGADRFVARREGRQVTLPQALYVAMTRARSLLRISGLAAPEGAAAQRVIAALELSTAQQAGLAEHDRPDQAMMWELQRRLGETQHAWLATLCDRVRLDCEPVRDRQGQVVAEPLFGFSHGRVRYVCLGEVAVSEQTAAALAELGVRVLTVGERLFGQAELFGA